jgi:hypothetical protein
MSLGVLELNDQALLMQSAGGSLYAEPGFARLNADGIETGEAARASAWREPQHSYNQFWSQLNQAAMATKQAWARHHADIAFAQLKSVWDKSGAPESLLILVPGSFNNTQLSLLLGMAGALPAIVEGVIDSALPPCYDTYEQTIYVDLALHQTVLTVCESQGRELSILDQEVFPDMGLMQIHNSVARHVSNLLIDSNRYDPLHTSESEQIIFDQIPDWLSRLRWEKEISAVLHSEQGELPFILRNESVRGLLAERLTNIHSFVARHHGSRLVLSHSSALMAGLTDEFADAEVASQDAGIAPVLSMPSRFFDPDDELYRVRSIRRDEAAEQTPSETNRIATHLLYRDQAMSLKQPVSIRLNGSGLQLATSVDRNAALTVVLRNEKLETIQSDPELITQLPGDCCPGETIMVGDHELMLIEVQDPKGRRDS